MNGREHNIIAFNPWYPWVRGRQLEGTLTGDQQTGIWPITALRVAYGWGNVPEAVWPYDPPSKDWPPIEAEGLDQIAKRYRILLYQRVRDLSDCKLALAKRHAVMAAFEITQEWFDAPDGKIEAPQSDDKIIGSHAVTLLGVTENGSEIRFANSWGDKWGDRGFGNLPSSYFDHRIVSAWTFEITERENETTDFIQYLRLGFRTVLGDAIHIREIFDPMMDERLGWAIGVQRGSVLDIEDFFVRPVYRGRGFGHELCEMIYVLSKEMNLRIRIWFSHADQNGPLQEHLCESLGLTIMPSGVRWARFVAAERGSRMTAAKSVAKPTMWRAREGRGLADVPQR